MSLSNAEYFEYSRGLEKYHSIFNKIWEIGTPIFTHSAKTAEIVFNKQGMNLEFRFNPDFWHRLDFTQRQFVICHECLHVVLDHGYRAAEVMNSGDDAAVQAANLSMDVVVNELLISKFGFNRLKVDPKNEYVWLDVLEKSHGSAMLQDQNFEYYFNLIYKDLSKDQPQQDQDSKDNAAQAASGCGSLGGSSDNSGAGSPGSQIGPGNKQPQFLDQHGDEEPSKTSAYPGSNNLDSHTNLPSLDDDREMQNQLQNQIEKINDQARRELCESLGTDVVDEIKELKSSKGQKGGLFAGKFGTGSLDVMPPQRIIKKKRWETIIKKWMQSNIKDDINDCEVWQDTNRRLAGLFSDSNIHLPSEINTESPSKSKIQVYFFLDVSGSCSGLGPRFWKAARSLPIDRFNVNLFCFNTMVYSVKKDGTGMRTGGGTLFDILESQIQRDLADNKITKYPGAVFVITDGYGNRFKPEFPKKWHWFLTAHSTQNYIHNDSKIHKLTDFE